MKIKDKDFLIKNYDAIETFRIITIFVNKDYFLQLYFNRHPKLALVVDLVFDLLFCILRTILIIITYF